MRYLRLTTFVLCTALLLVLVLADAANACPTCKDNLTHNGQNLARGFYYSILFMLSMPFLIFGGLCSYFYWEVCRARRREEQSHLRSSAPAGLPTP